MVKSIDQIIQAIGIKKTAVGVGGIVAGGLVASTALTVIGILAILATQGLLPGAFSSLAGLHTGGGIAFIAVGTLCGVVLLPAFSAICKKTKTLSEKVRIDKTQIQKHQKGTKFGLGFKEFLHDDEQLLRSLERLDKNKQSIIESLIIDFEINLRACLDNKNIESSFFNFEKGADGEIFFFLNDEVEEEDGSVILNNDALIEEVQTDEERVLLTGITKINLITVLNAFVTYKGRNPFDYINDARGPGGLIAAETSES